MGYLKSANRYLVYLARGCDTYYVRFCPSVLGRELFDSLRRICDVGRHQLMGRGFPVPMRNRIAYGIAAACWGGRDKHICLVGLSLRLTSHGCRRKPLTTGYLHRTPNSRPGEASQRGFTSGSAAQRIRSRHSLRRMAKSTEQRGSGPATG